MILVFLSDTKKAAAVLQYCAKNEKPRSGVIKMSYDRTALQTEIQQQPLKSQFFCLLLFNLKCITLTHLSCPTFSLLLSNDSNECTHII